MNTSETTRLDNPLLVIAYDDKAREVIAGNLGTYGVSSVDCATFCEAERFALRVPCSGVVVDLATIIKAKAEEKAVAYTLTGYYPTLRVKAMGTMLIPMAMAGDAKQDKSLNDFLSKTCAEFKPRLLRSNRRKDICVPTNIGNERGFTLNISWNGLFIVDMNPERFSIGDKPTVSIPNMDLEIEVIVARIQDWGKNSPPGIGVKFSQMDDELELKLFTLLKSAKDRDRDRVAV